MIRFSLEIFIWFAAVLSNCLSNFGCVYDDGKIRLEYRSFLAQKFFKLPFIDLPISFDRTETVWVGSTLTFEHVIFETCECHEPNYSKSSVKQIDRSPQTKINFSSLDEVNKGDFFGKLELSYVKLTNPSYRSFIEQRDQRAVLHNVFKLTDPTAFGGFTPPANQTLNEFRGPRYANPSLLEDAESTDVKFLEWSDSILNGVPVKLLTYQRPVTHQRDKNHDELRTIFFAADDGRILKWIAFLPSNPKKAIAEANYTYSLIEGKVAPQECRMEEFDDLNLESIVVSSYRNFQYLESVDVKRFFLTYFGLAEPDWYTPPRPWWLYSSLAGMGLLVAGALLLKYGKGVWNRN